MTRPRNVDAGRTLPIVWAPLTTRASGHTATIHVATDTRSFGVPGPAPSARSRYRAILITRPVCG